MLAGHCADLEHAYKRPLVPSHCMTRRRGKGEFLRHEANQLIVATTSNVSGGSPQFEPALGQPAWRDEGHLRLASPPLKMQHPARRKIAVSFVVERVAKDLPAAWGVVDEAP